MQTNGLNLTCTQTILSHCFDFVLQGCLGEWDRASARLPTYLSHRGSGQDVVQENWILEKNDSFFFLFFEMRFHFFFEKQQISFFFFFGTRGDPLNNYFGKSKCLRIEQISLIRKDQDH